MNRLIVGTVFLVAVAMDPNRAEPGDKHQPLVAPGTLTSPAARATANARESEPTKVRTLADWLVAHPVVSEIHAASSSGDEGAQAIALRTDRLILCVSLPLLPKTRETPVLCTDLADARLTGLSFADTILVAEFEEGLQRSRQIYRMHNGKLQSKDLPTGKHPTDYSSRSLALAPWPKNVQDEDREVAVENRIMKSAISIGRSPRDWRNSVLVSPSWVGIMDSASGVFSKTVLKEKDLIVSEIRSRSADDGSLAGEDSERILVARVGNAWHRGARGVWAESLRAIRCVDLFPSCVAITSIGETVGGSSLNVPYGKAVQLGLLRIDDRGIAAMADIDIGERGYIRDTGTRSRIWEVFFRVDADGPLRVRIQREVARVIPYSRQTKRVSQATEIDLNKPVASCEDPSDVFEELRCRYRELPGSYVIGGGELHRAANTMPAQHQPSH